MDPETIIHLLETYKKEIYIALGEKWRDFTRELYTTIVLFENVKNQRDLSIAVDVFFRICIQYSEVKAILRKHNDVNIGDFRKLNPKPQKRTDIPGIVQRYITFIVNTQK